MTTFGKTISHKDREINIGAILDPSSAQLQLWLAQIKRDHSDISGREMEQVEIAAQPMQSRARCMYNPFTGEFKRIKWSD